MLKTKQKINRIWQTTLLLVYNEKSFDSEEHSAVFKSLMKFIRKLLKYQVHRIKTEKGVRQGNTI